MYQLTLKEKKFRQQHKDKVYDCKMKIEKKNCIIPTGCESSDYKLLTSQQQ